MEQVFRQTVWLDLCALVHIRESHIVKMNACAYDGWVGAILSVQNQSSELLLCYFSTFSFENLFQNISDFCIHLHYTVRHTRAHFQNEILYRHTKNSAYQRRAYYSYSFVSRAKMSHNDAVTWCFIFL